MAKRKGDPTLSRTPTHSPEPPKTRKKLSFLVCVVVLLSFSSVSTLENRHRFFLSTLKTRDTAVAIRANT